MPVTRQLGKTMQRFVVSQVKSIWIERDEIRISWGGGSCWFRMGCSLTFIEHMGMSWPPPPMSPWSMWLWSMAAWWEWSIITLMFFWACLLEDSWE